MSAAALVDLHAAAMRTGRSEDWAAFAQMLAGTTLIVPLDASAGETLRPSLSVLDGVQTLLVHGDMDSFATAIAAPGNCAEIPGVELAEMLRGQSCALALAGDPMIIVPAEQLVWIAETFGAEVTRATGAGVSVSRPALPPIAVMEALGQAVDALGADCPEAWLVDLTEENGDPELVLVLGLSDSVRGIESELAETVTRTVQAATDRPFAVACPDRGAPLMDSARRSGIGIG